MAAIKQHLWAEWREQRGNLLGLWAGLVLCILAAWFLGAGRYVVDPQAPVLFGALGYVAFSLAILPRVFSGQSVARYREALERSPSGLNSAFLGKAIFVNLSMAMSVLLPFGITAALMFFAAPERFDRFVYGHSGFDLFAVPLLAVHTLPLVLMTWRLPLRWVVVGIGLTAVLMGCAVRGTFR